MSVNWAQFLRARTENGSTQFRITIHSALNRGFKEWNEVFPNASCIVTLVDRLTHHADVTRIEGDSYRLRESEMEAATRRKKK
jgi:DNA replication protein DnaC